MAAVLALGRLGPYTVAKHGVLGLSDVLRAEFASLDAPVGVSVVMPGMIKTGMNPIGTVPSAVVAANVVDAIRRGRSYVFTDDHSTRRGRATASAPSSRRGVTSSAEDRPAGRQRTHRFSVALLVDAVLAHALQ